MVMSHSSEFQVINCDLDYRGSTCRARKAGETDDVEVRALVFILQKSIYFEWPVTVVCFKTVR